MLGDAFPNEPTGSGRQRITRPPAQWLDCVESTCAARENSGPPRLNWLMPQPAFEIFGQRKGRRIAARGIFLEALQADRAQIAIHFGIPKARISRLGFQNRRMVS